ncbi:LON peptidase substrate-binding domain-containing protein [Nocardioides insulae]|uniref:LON peptidase substrate-binding domain-containing protein n=1 Tax=Nocardioides insulae TaxID=394734 RepID=UPI0003F9C04C|nr:LON peptidase substrate-binding domain-containing protein [Nocardioides insulae]
MPTLPMFPLNSVVFPGLSVPLHIFEDRYRALVHHLLRIKDPAERLFATVAIREGYEVGDHGAQSLFRVGVSVQVTDIEAHPDGTFDIVGIGRERLRLEGIDSSGPFPQAGVTMLPEPQVAVPQETLDRARATFTAYRAALVAIDGDPYDGTLPRDPEYLSWTLSAAAPLPMMERQTLLESLDAERRLEQVTLLLRDELRAMNVIPSLPASQVARTRWSPN